MPNYEQIFKKYFFEYLNEALPVCEQILKGNVPIDTRALQESIEAYIENDKGIFGVKDITLDYSEKAARMDGKGPFEVEESMESAVLAQILEIGIGNFRGTKKPLFRSRYSDSRRFKRDDPTDNWFKLSLDEIEDIIISMAQKHVNGFLNESINETFLDLGWKRV